MKSIKFLAALAIPAMFAACTNEEIAVESPKQFNQAVGAELIGTNVSMAMSNEANSRMGNTGWEETDKLGLGWIVNGKCDSKQDLNKTPDSNTWYANHLFYVDAETQKFVSQGNLYKGWHFAYYPFSYMEGIGSKTWNINPPQTSKEWVSGRVNDALCISPLKFLVRENLDDNYQLKPEVKFAVQRAVNSIHVKTTAADQFAAGKSLADLNVKSITLAMAGGKNYPFCNSVEMNVQNLPKETNTTVAVGELVASFYAEENPVLKKTPLASITTDVEKAGFKVSEQTELITLTAPYAGGDLDIAKLSMEVEAGSGTFKIEYVADAEEGSNAYINNEALVALKNALAKGADLTQVNKKVYLDVVLYADIFKTDFLHISDLTEWKDAVDMVAKLGRTTEIFGIDGVIEFNEGNIPMPEGCAITVNEADDAAGDVGLKITKNIASWPADLTSNVKVYNEKTISNATGINGEQIINTGTLKGISAEVNSPVINEKGNISLTKTGALANVNNAGGRITVAYGSIVKFATGATDKGIVAYTVASKEYAYKLNNLMSTSAEKTANVNTLIVKEGRTLDMGLTDAGNSDNDDPYKPTGATDDVKLASLENINIELNGGTIVGGETNKAVKNVTMTSGVVNDVNIKGDLNAESGTITSGTIEGDVTVENGTTTLNGVKINGTLTVKAGASVVLNSTEYIYISNIVNNGTLTANNDIFVTNVTLNPKSTTTLTDKEAAEMDWNKIIYYTDNYVNDKITLNGTVLKYKLVSYDDTKDASANGETLFNAAKNAEEGAVVYAPAGEYKFTGQLDMSKVAAIIGEEGTVIKLPSSQRVLNVYLGYNKEVILKNIAIEANTTRADIWLRTGDTSGKDNVPYSTIKVIMENVSCKTAIIDNAYVDGGIVNAELFGCKIDEFTIDAWDVHPTLNTTTYTNVTYDGTCNVTFKKGGNAPDNVSITQK